eukprot:CAMPEP_0119311206 /NCGR_PEP_ID=MMETSP1333-20130426/21971_1 /TAXON_ID=418940 /ORGANISM="Scyphosphaera apsteinii, Strain RCC1455" /LENGTH=155 /DNA_ID=CAMNT_0007315533 /DNA_START=11 /DNA_END=478 /DNA_ORIENTATION=+
MFFAAFRRGVQIPTAVRAFRAGKPAHGGTSETENLRTMLFKSDHSSAGMHIYHKLNFALIGLGPAALVLSPSALNYPVDIALGIIIPLHSHIGGNDVITDYAHKITKAKAFENSLRIGLFGVTVVTFVGLLKLNLQGPGVTETLKSFWRSKKADK